MDSQNRIRTGDKVVIAAKDEFYSFVDGWCGLVVGWNAGHAEVACDRPDGEKRLFVPPDQLHLNVMGAA